MTATGALMVTLFSTKGVALFVMISVLFFTVGDCKCYDCTYGQVCCKYDCVDGYSCVGYSCDHDQDCSRSDVETCCKSPEGVIFEKACVKGDSCIGQSCSYDSDCSFNQTCCRSKCVGGTTCLGRSCSYNSDCSIDEVCCNKKCKAGSDCIGESCSSYSNCQTGEDCCKEKCVKTIGGCPIPENSDTGLVTGLSAGAGGVVFVCTLVASILGARRRRRRLRLLLGANVTQNVTTTITTAEDGTAIVTEQITTSVSANPVTQCNPLYQPEGPPSDQPPPYTEPASGVADGTYAPQNDSFTPRTAGIV